MKKKFEIGYSMTVYCEVTVEAESKEEAEDMYLDGMVETSIDRDCYKTKYEEIDYIREAGEE